MKLLTCCVGLIGLLLSGCAGSDKCPVDHVDLNVLLSHMTNLNTFAEAPLGNSFLESSYDRSGGNVDWITYEKTQPNGRINVFEAEGPGYVSRFWIASFYAKKWFFFFDGESEPRLVLDKEDFFGEKFPFVSPLAGQSGGGRYSLVPIPFSKSLRIEMEPTSLKPTHRNYFQVNYTRLNLKSEQVESFPRELSSAQSNLVVLVNKTQRTEREVYADLISKSFKGGQSQQIPPQGEITFWTDDAEGVLESFCIKIDHPIASEVMSKELLRRLRIQLFWDGSSQPSVDVPLGDFFCNPFYYRSFSSMPLAQIDGVFVSRFPMPYQKGARCVLVNTSAEPVSVSVGAQGNRESAGGLHRKFHAVWRAQNTSGVPFQMLETSGAGHYVGCFLSAVGQDGSWTILEGDEYLRPDPEKQPPQLGTGLEDYFNGAYYYTSLFDLSLHGLIEKGAMRTDQYRFHLLEAVRFNKAFEAGIEFGDQNQAKGYMSSVLYWYADKATAVPFSAMQSHLLNRPGDRFELPGLMAPFFLLERAGLYADAAARMDFFAWRHHKQPWSDLLKVRALGYREKTEGFDSVQKEYQEFTKSKYPPAAQAALDHLWLHTNSTNALLGIHALGKYRLFQDGQLVAEGEGKNELRVLRTAVFAGEHTWTVEFVPTRPGSFYSHCLRTKAGQITSEGTWDVAEFIPYPGRKSLEFMEGKSALPNMGIWAFEPNSYINMQSPAAGIGGWASWDRKPLLEKVTLKKNWSSKDIRDEISVAERERSDEELKAHAIN